MDAISAPPRSFIAAGSRAELAAVAAVSAVGGAAVVSLLVFGSVGLNLTVFLAGGAALAAAASTAVFWQVGPYSALPRLLGLLPLLACGGLAFFATTLPAMFDAAIAASRADIAAGRAEAPDRELVSLMGTFVCLAGAIAGAWLFAETLRDHRASEGATAVWSWRVALLGPAVLVWSSFGGAGYFASFML